MGKIKRPKVAKLISLSNKETESLMMVETYFGQLMEGKKFSRGGEACLII